MLKKDIIPLFSVEHSDRQFSVLVHEYQPIPPELHVKQTNQEKFVNFIRENLFQKTLQLKTYKLIYLGSRNFTCDIPYVKE